MSVMTFLFRVDKLNLPHCLRKTAFHVVKWAFYGVCHEISFTPGNFVEKRWRVFSKSEYFSNIGGELLINKGAAENSKDSRVPLMGRKVEAKVNQSCADLAMIGWS